MILGIGSDIQAVVHAEEGIAEYGQRFLETILTSREIEYANKDANPSHRVAARIAAKEAAVKALGTGFTDEIDWLNFEVVNKESGQPELLVYGKALELIQAMGNPKIWVSLSQSEEYAIAYVILEK